MLQWGMHSGVHVAHGMLQLGIHSRVHVSHGMLQWGIHNRVHVAHGMLQWGIHNRVHVAHGMLQWGIHNRVLVAHICCNEGCTTESMTPLFYWSYCCCHFTSGIKLFYYKGVIWKCRRQLLGIFPIWTSNIIIKTSFYDFLQKITRQSASRYHRKIALKLSNFSCNTLVFW